MPGPIIELLCFFQVIEIKFDPDKLRADWLDGISSGFSIALAGGNACPERNGDFSTTIRALARRTFQASQDCLYSVIWVGKVK